MFSVWERSQGRFMGMHTAEDLATNRFLREGIILGYLFVGNPQGILSA
jgi:hypothetical protein